MKTFSLRQISILLSSIFLIHTTVKAQNKTTLKEVVVVAKPLIESTKIDSFASVSTVISQAQIRDLNAVDLASTLRHTPGVQIARYNPVGSFGGDQGGAIFIRGMGVSRPGSEIKTSIDGLPFYMGLWNHPLLDLLPINGMQSITVHKSPQPQVNGNNFASINLQSLNAVADSVKAQGNIRMSGGSFGTFIEQLNFGGRVGKMDYGIAQGYARSDGHRPNADGELKNIMANVGYTLNTNWRAEVRFLYVNNLASDPGDARTTLPTVAPEYNTEAGMLSAGLLHKYDKIQGELRLYTNRATGSWLNQPALDGNTISRSNMSGLRWKEQIQPWKQATFLAGLDFDHLGGSADFDRIAPDPQADFDAPSFNLISPYTALSQNFSLSDKWNLRPSIGVRYYNHNQFKATFAPHAGLLLESPKFSFFGDISKGINYPGLEAPLLSSLITALGTTWEQLKPEELNHLGVGVKWSITNTTFLDLNLFQDNVKNRYVFAYPPSVTMPQFTNLGDYRIQGLELSVKQNFAEKWIGFAGLTLLDPSISNLPYTPKTAVTAGVNGRIGRFGIVLDGQYQSEVWSLNRKRADGAVNSEKVDEFTVVNTRISYQLPILGSQGELFTTVENLFDATNYYRPGYVMPGRWFQIGLSASLTRGKTK